jgi:hypothetical protein
MVAVLILGTSSVLSAQEKETKAKAHDSGEPAQILSPAFQEMALRASDALERLPDTMSRRDKGDNYYQLILDAQKAIAEAKYKATSQPDKNLLRRLQTDLNMTETLALFEVLDSRWRQVQDIRLQCWIEIQYGLNPESLNDKAKGEAAKRGLPEPG